MKPCVVLIIPPMGYNQNEYLSVKETLEDYDCKVTTVSTQSGTAAAHHPESTVVDESKPTTAHVDLTVDEVNALDYQGIFVIGGPGTTRHLSTHNVHKLLSDARNFDLYYGGIGTACRVLADANVVRDKQATGWNDDNKLPEALESAGCSYVHENLVVSDHLITAKSHAAKQFAETIAHKVSWYY